jgi:hypothetical protein
VQAALPRQVSAAGAAGLAVAAVTGAAAGAAGRRMQLRLVDVFMGVARYEQYRSGWSTRFTADVVTLRA